MMAAAVTRVFKLYLSRGMGEGGWVRSADNALEHDTELSWERSGFLEG